MVTSLHSPYWAILHNTYYTRSEGLLPAARSTFELESLPTLNHLTLAFYRSGQDLTSKTLWHRLINQPQTRLWHTSNATLKMATNSRKKQRKLSELAKKSKAAQAAQKAGSATSAPATYNNLKKRDNLSLQLSPK